MGRIGRRGFVAGAALAVLGVTGSHGTAAAAGTPGARSGTAGAVRKKRRAAGEFRGMWLATVFNVDWPSSPGLTPARQRTELLAHLDMAVERRLNAVVLQVRPSADALWPSPHEPWAECLTGVQGRDPGWDPLGTAVAEAHRRGLELHAWFNPYRVANHTDPSRLTPTHPARRNPGWTVPYGGKLYYNPGLPEVRRFVQDAMLDAVRRYDIDAVHWDDYFYPYPVVGQVFDDDDAYARYGGGFANRAAWRRNNIDLLVSEMSARIKETGGAPPFGISPFGIWRNSATDPGGSDTPDGLQSYDDLFADTRRWIREGWIDYVVPQLYWHIGFADADYATLVPWWEEAVRDTGVRLYIGEALFKCGDPGQPDAWQDPEELSRHLTLAARYPGVAGHCYFSATQVTADRIGAMAAVVADHYPTPALPPSR